MYLLIIFVMASTFLREIEPTKVNLKVYYDSSFLTMNQGSMIGVDKKMKKLNRVLNDIFLDLNITIYFDEHIECVLEEKFDADREFLEYIEYMIDRNSTANLNLLVSAFNLNYRGEIIETIPKPIYGLSYQGSICHPDASKRVLILQWQKDLKVRQNANILVHELGHSLGIEHDFITDDDDNAGDKIERFSSNHTTCTNIGGYMDYNEFHLIRKWTLCSLEDYEAFVKNEIHEKGQFCLDDCQNKFSKCDLWTNEGIDCNFSQKYFCPKSCHVC